MSTDALIGAVYSGSIAPDWTVGIAIGLGGLAGGWSGPASSRGCRRRR